MPDWTRDAGPTTDTRLHRLLREALGDLGWYVEDEVRVGPYSLDCYVRETHLGYEADGARWHSTRAQQRRDAQRDGWILDRAGIHVCRVEEGLFAPNHGQGLRSWLAEWTGWYLDTIEERRRVAQEKLGGV